MIETLFPEPRERRISRNSLIAGEDYDHERLRRLRKAAKLTATEVALRLHLTRMTIWLSENRRVSIPVLKQLSALHSVPWKSFLITH